MEAAATVENRNGRFPTAAWKTLRVFHSSHSPLRLVYTATDTDVYTLNRSRDGDPGGECF